MLTRAQFNHGFAITPSDTVNFPNGPCDAIYVGGAGIAEVVFQDDSTAQLTTVPNGYLWVRAKRVNFSNTTASLMIALYEV